MRSIRPLLRLRAALPVAAVASLVALTAIPSAQATGVVVYGTGNPAYTKGTQDTQFVTWNSTGYDDYKLNLLYSNDMGTSYPQYWSSTLGGNKTGNFWVDWSGVATLQDGHYYGICVTGYGYWNYLSAWSPSLGTTSCGDAAIAGKRTGTTIDRNAPSISAFIDGTKDVTNDPKLALHIDYQDATSPPWFGANGRASNWVCITRGTPCTPTGSPDPNCSAANNPTSRITSFDCQADVSSQPDAKYYFCTFAADAAIPDNPTNADQFAGATSNKANLSGVACGFITLDRTPPAVQVTPSTATAAVGQLVTFNAAAQDSSGVGANFDWDYGDNTAHSTGATGSHTFTQPGTFQVKATTTDTAGNAGSGATTVTVSPTTSGTTAPGTGGGTGTGIGVTPTATPPTNQTISTEAGGGGTTQATVAGLKVIAPKRLRLTSKPHLTLGIVANGGGKLLVSVRKGKKTVAKKTATLKSAGSFTIRVALPRKLKAGKYKIVVSFTPAGTTRAKTKTFALTIVAKKRLAREASRAPVTPNAATLRGNGAASKPAPATSGGEIVVHRGR